MSGFIHASAVAAFACWLIFLAAYSVLAKWWRKPEGRNVWGVALALTVALGMVVASYTWPGYAFRPVVVTAVYLGLAALAVQRTVQMVRRQMSKPPEG